MVCFLLSMLISEAGNVCSRFYFEFGDAAAIKNGATGNFDRSYNQEANEFVLLLE